jgi:hypothetical protein
MTVDVVAPPSSRPRTIGLDHPSRTRSAEPRQARPEGCQQGVTRAHCQRDVCDLLKAQDSTLLATSLNLHLTHKRGGLHHWADICQAGWTEDYATLIDIEEHKAQVGVDAESESNGK